MRDVKLSAAIIKRACKSISNLLAKYRHQLSVGQIARWAIGAIATLVLAWLSAGVRGRFHYVAPWPFVLIVVAAVGVAIALIVIPRSIYSKLFSENFGWL